MTPPIREGDGDGIGSIRLGDGTEIAEARTGAGDVLFSAEPEIPDSVVDHFEESLYGDQAKSLSDYYSGDLGVFSRQQSTVESGSYALEADADGGIGAASAPGTSPAKGDTFECYTLFAGGDDAGVAWGTDGPVISGDGYEMDVRSGGDSALRRWSDGFAAEILDSSSASVPTGEWLRVHVDWGSDDTHTVTVSDSAGSQLFQLSATDNNYAANTGIGFRNGGAGTSTVYWDGYQIL